VWVTIIIAILAGAARHRDDIRRWLVSWKASV
jgi:hypothetical protein